MNYWLLLILQNYDEHMLLPPEITRALKQVNETEHNKYNMYYSIDAFAEGSPSNFASNIKRIQDN